jgi:hypothetical protein
MVNFVYVEVGDCGDQFSLKVKILCDKQPAKVTLNIEGGIQPQVMGKSGETNTYSTSMSRSPMTNLTNNEKEQLMAPYRLVGDWRDAKENMYLAIRPNNTPEIISLIMYHFKYSGDDPNYDDANYKELSKIESLGSDFESLLEKYFRARAFHYAWRHDKQLPDHFCAMRSARLWFDAAYKMVETNYSIFRMDEEVSNIVDDYENRSKEDEKLKKRWREFTKAGYISGMKRQLLAIDYMFIREIPILVSKRQFELADHLNSIALTSLSAADKNTINTVNKLQGINMDLLKKNEIYISSMR